MELSSPSNPDVDPSARPSRRKSGRVIKAPELLVTQGNAKRKRAGGDEDNDNIDAEEEEESSDDADASAEEADEEELREQRRAKKRGSTGKTGAKRPKTTNTANASLALRPAPTAKLRKPKKTGQMRQSAVNSAASGLYADVFASEDSLDDVVASWLGRFKAHQAKGLMEIVNFVLRSAGCTLEVNVYDIEDPDNASSRLIEIQEEFQAQNIVDYPLIAKNKNAATFKKTLAGFFNSLIKSVAAASILYDNPELIENTNSWIGTMSSAAARPFRHTAAYISFAIISSLCEVARDVTISRAKFLRQEEGERKKKGKINQQRVKSFQDQAQEATRQRAILDDFIKDWFGTVFIHRYRDVDPKVRLDAMTHLGEWIMVYPDFFLDGQYLRYLGWVLSDVSGPVRHEVLKQIQKIAKDENKVPGLRVFTERFRSRVVEMAVGDAETNVRAAAVDLLETLRAPGLLEPSDIDTVCKLIYDSELRVRKAVVPFLVASVEDLLASKFDDLGGEEPVTEALQTAAENDYEQPRLEWLRLKSLAELIRSFEDTEETGTTVGQHAAGGMEDIMLAAVSESRTTLAAQAIFPEMPDLKRWELLTGYLLYDHSQIPTDQSSEDVDVQFRSQCKLDEREEIVLLDVLNVSVRAALTDIMEATSNKKIKKSKAELRDLQTQREIAAQRLANVIPKLLKKFGAAPEAASAVLRLERALNLEVFEELRQDSTTYAALLDDINKQFMSHESRNVLLEASNALQHAKSFEELGEITEAKLGALWDHTTRSCSALCRGEDLGVRGGMDPSVLSDLTNEVIRISHLARISDCTSIFDTPRQSATAAPRRKQSRETPVAPISLLTEILGRGRPTARTQEDMNQKEDDLVSHTLTCLMFYFMWKVAGFRSALTAGQAPHDDDITTLAERRNTVAAQLDAIIQHRQAADPLRVTAAGALLDLHSMFIVLDQDPTAEQAEESAPFSDLLVEITQTRQSTILKVFKAVETNFANKSGHQLEPEPDDDPEELPDADEDPVSDDDDEASMDGNEDDEEQLRRKQARAAQKQKEALLAEEQFCMLASKIVIALHAGLLDKGQQNGPIRTRLRRNRAKLGHNFKEIIAMLEKGVPVAKAKKSVTKKDAAQSNKASKSGVQKSKEVVVESDEDEEVTEEGEDEEVSRAGAEESIENAVNGVDTAEAEVESVIGD